MFDVQCVVDDVRHEFIFWFILADSGLRVAVVAVHLVANLYQPVGFPTGPNQGPDVLPTGAARQTMSFMSVPQPALCPILPWLSRSRALTEFSPRDWASAGRPPSPCPRCACDVFERARPTTAPWECDVKTECSAPVLASCCSCAVG